MRKLMCLVAGAFAASASAAGAQSLPPSHEQHEAAGQHQVPPENPVTGTGEKCCCEEMMRKMMMEMMQHHQGMGKMPMDASQPEQGHAH